MGKEYLLSKTDNYNTNGMGMIFEIFFYLCQFSPYSAYIDQDELRIKRRAAQISLSLIDFSNFGVRNFKTDEQVMSINPV